LSGFGSGACLVSFYLRVGGGIFSKGADLGGDLVGEMSESKFDEERRVFELQQRMENIANTRKERLQKGLEDDEEEALDQLRLLEEEMQDICADLHPIDFLDEIGEVICDVTGTCADLFESMVLILSTSAIIGAKISAVPHFLTGLPFWIVASGNIGCAVATFKVHCTE
ncbi:hppA, partial [Symbiodinium necroappetens]